MEAAAKNFRKRNAILDYLHHTQAHPSAETIFTELKQQIPDLSIGTVYRNLSLFKQQGKVVSVANVKGVERFDANIEPHVHFICEDCSAVTDLHQMKLPSAVTAEAESAIGCKVEACHVSFTGICKACLRKKYV